MDVLHVVDFVLGELAGDGTLGNTLLEVTEVAVLNDRGQELGRFHDAESLRPFLFKARGHARLVAVRTVGLPRLDLVGRYICYEQLCSEAAPVGTERR